MTERHENLISAYFADQITDSEREELLSLLETDAEFASCFREMEEAYIPSVCVPVDMLSMRQVNRIVWP